MRKECQFITPVWKSYGQIQSRRLNLASSTLKQQELSGQILYIFCNDWNTPGTAGGPGGRAQGLAVKSWKDARKSVFFLRKKIKISKFFFCIYLLVIPKYWVNNYFTHGRFPELGQKQKTEKKRKEKIDWTMVITMAKLRMAPASTHGTRKPPGPIFIFYCCSYIV